MKILAILLLAHVWYPSDCCAERHCHPTPCELITAGDAGYHWRNLVFPRAKAHPSHDALCHVCHEMLEGAPYNPLCIFLPVPA